MKAFIIWKEKPAEINAETLVLTGEMQSGGFHTEPVSLQCFGGLKNHVMEGDRRMKLEGTLEIVWHSHRAEEKMKAQKVNCFAYRTHEWQSWDSRYLIPAALFQKERGLQ